MKRENALPHGKNFFALGFYSKPTAMEVHYGRKILNVLTEALKNKKIEHVEKFRQAGYMTVGSAISNIKLEKTCKKHVRERFIMELYNNLDAVECVAIWLDIEGEKYTTFAFKNEDIQCLFL